MRADQETMIDTAIGWHVKLAEAQEADWAAFVAWLEADPAHAAAYDTIAMQDRVVADARFPDKRNAAPVAHNDNHRTRWRWAVGGSVAAAAVAAVLLPGLLSPGASPYDVATRPGQTRTVALADGTRIELSGGTRLRLDRAGPRVAALERGEATFHVRHDAAHPFAVTSGGVTLRDVGTVFDVARQGDQLAVAVSDGAVLFQPEREAVTLSAGDALRLRERDGRIVRSKVAPEAVGGWRTGVLSFDGQSLDEVAATLNRLYATNLALEGGLSRRPFTGMIHVTGAADRDVPHLAALIGAHWRRDGERWILSAE